MGICGCFLVAAGFFWRVAGKRLSADQKKMLGVAALFAAVGALAGVAEQRETRALATGSLERNPYGDGDYIQEFVVSADGYAESMTYAVTVPEQRLTESGEKAYLAAAAADIRQEFPGENTSVNHIEGGVGIREDYQEGKVLASWSFDDHTIVNAQGKIIAEDLPAEGVLVKAKAVLSCGSTERTEEIYFRVFPKTRSGTEELAWKIERILKKQASAEGETQLQLPQQIDGRQLRWQAASTHTPEKLFLFGLVTAAFVPWLSYSKKQEAKKQKERCLELEYPEIVSKLALLLGAGMTLQGALRKIAFTYAEKRKKKLVEVLPAYEELLVVCREMENGMGECAAYERMGMRCGIANYRKLGNLLSQNLRKGSYGIVTLLEQEAERAYEERKGAARRYGEEAGTKLLLPMMFMLGLVMTVLIVPAMAAFQM